VRWLGLFARLVVGGVWIVAGVLKISDPTESVRAVRAYDLLPESLVPLVGHGLPVLEIVLGLALVVGLLTRWAAVVSAIVLIAFIVGISSAWARGLQIECGCFGGGGPTRDATSSYPWEIARDVGLLLLAGFLVWRPRTPFSLDERLLPVVPPVVPRTADAGAGGARGARTRASQRAAEIRREAAAADQRRRNLVVGLGAAAAMLAVVVVGSSVQAGRDVTGTPSQVPSGTVDTYAFAHGAKHPSTVVDVYEDFMCPYCGQFEKLSEGLVQRYADRGVQFRYHVIAFLDRASTTQYSTRAASALGVVLDTTGPAAAKRFHDELYAQQPQEGSAGLSDGQLVQLAVQAGAQESAVKQGIDDHQYAQWAANANDAASKAGVNGTPTVLVGGKQVGGADVPAIVQTLGQELASATSS
jgi:protein-disulfide isomerase/uncharacterized membrane protein YphA (DoxX/SURF4 family)